MEGILGVLGGMGPQATNTFYQRIIDRTQADTDQEHLRVLIWSDAKIPDRTAGILGTPEQAEAEIARLLSSGQMSREQFQELKENAKFILKFLK